MFNFCLLSGPHSKRALRWISLTCLCVCMLLNRIADIYASSRSLLLTCTLVLFLTCVFFLARQTPHLQVTNSETIRQSIIPARRKGRNSDPCSFPCRTPTTSTVKHNDATKPQEGNQFFFNTRRQPVLLVHMLALHLHVGHVSNSSVYILNSQIQCMVEPDHKEATMQFFFNKRRQPTLSVRFHVSSM